ncbi:hypothetical protein HELRODRAFT_173704 [Helobdella robusta]|uniref:Uncharacterized protein n=1 Tax=Helobdella robusta TaxID=6412 RepID=T1F750_HELRO|nr:hypothetical protein HELRODRAFT_173704 [Helobdella robusta]ESO03407.1 hypothetical protein HELRODRAFT_173704 [Helobdella robusta]
MKRKLKKLILLSISVVVIVCCLCKWSVEYQPRHVASNSLDENKKNNKATKNSTKNSNTSESLTTGDVRPSKPDTPLLIIFTTFKDDSHSTHHKLAHRIITKNWISFGLEYIKPVLFTNSSLAPKFYNRDTVPKPETLPFEASLAEIALSHGWDLLPIPAANSHGTPYLKPMVKEIFKNYNATFYGFANGDLLFDETLTRSLNFIKSYLKHPLENNAMLIGRRIDVMLYSNNTVIPEKQHLRQTSSTTTTTTTTATPIVTVSVKPKNGSGETKCGSSSSGGSDSSSNSSSNATKTTTTTSTTPKPVVILTPEYFDNLLKYYNASNLVNLAKIGTLRPDTAIDYFFFTRDGSRFNWSALADVVIGRDGYDNYLIAMANITGCLSIDLTSTVRCIHLSKPGVKNTGYDNRDNHHNLNIFGYQYVGRGKSSVTNYYTEKNERGYPGKLISRYEKNKAY